MVEDIKFTDLKSIRLSRPCRASWKEMQQIEGNCVRHCDICDLHVYNLSEMSRREAVKLVEQHQGHLCVHFYRRRDGTILTRNCPVGVQAYNRLWLVKAWRIFCILVNKLMTRLFDMFAPPLLKSLKYGYLGGIDAEYPPCPKDLQDIRDEKQREQTKEIQNRLKELTEESLREILARQAREANKEPNS